MGALADPKAPSDSEAMASDKLDKTKAAPYEIIKQQKTNHDRSSTCAHFRGARCGNSACRDLRGGRRAIDVTTLIGNKMSHGKAIIEWSEPKIWNQAARRIAKQEGVRLFPLLSWIGLLVLIGGLVVWEWIDADPATRASIPEIVGIISTLFGVLLGLSWIKVLLWRTNSTGIYMGGVAHGSRFNKQWVPWDQIEYFYTDEHKLESVTFRFLSWQQAGLEDESFSVLPDTVDLQAVVHQFKNNKVRDGDAEEAV